MNITADDSPFNEVDMTEEEFASPASAFDNEDGTHPSIAGEIVTTPSVGTWEQHARFLFNLLDDIDTASDIAKADHELYRVLVERLHRKRFNVAKTDGYTVEFAVTALKE